MTFTEKDIEELYTSLQANEWFIQSFQMKRKWPGHPPNCRYPAVNMDMDYPIMADLNQVYNKVNQRFGENLSDSDRGDTKVYVWLEKDPSGKSILFSYGNAHMDPSNRSNSHYFAIVSDFDKLSQVIDSFVDDPKNMSKFVKEVFRWKNESDFHFSKGEPDLYTRMKELYVDAPKSGQKKVTV